MGERPRGPTPDWTPSTPRQEALLADVLQNYDRLNVAGQLPRSPRGTFYDLRPSGFRRGVRYLKRVKDPQTGRKPDLAEMDADPAVVQEIVVHAVRALLIPEAWVADERAPDPIVPLEFADAEEGVGWIDGVVDDFRIERQRGQDRYVEVWCEAAGIAPRLAIVADPYGVPVYPGGGFDGLKGKRAGARRIAERDVPTVALHVADYDRHGRWIFAAVAEDVAAWVPFYAEGGERWAGASWAYGWKRDDGVERLVLSADDEPVLTVIRLAVTAAQVEAGIVEIDEEGKAEAEAMPTDWSILSAALDALLLPASREAAAAQDEPEAQRLRSLLAGRWRDG